MLHAIFVLLWSEKLLCIYLSLLTHHEWNSQSGFFELLQSRRAKYQQCWVEIYFVLLKTLAAILCWCVFAHVGTSHLYFFRSSKDPNDNYTNIDYKYYDESGSNLLYKGHETAMRSGNYGTVNPPPPGHHIVLFRNISPWFSSNA